MQDFSRENTIRVEFLGPTGAGKTTLYKQIIDSNLTDVLDPKKVRKKNIKKIDGFQQWDAFLEEIKLIIHESPANFSERFTESILHYTSRAATVDLSAIKGVFLFDESTAMKALSVSQRSKNNWKRILKRYLKFMPAPEGLIIVTGSVDEVYARLSSREDKEVEMFKDLSEEQIKKMTKRSIRITNIIKKKLKRRGTKICVVKIQKEEMSQQTKKIIDFLNNFNLD